MRSRLLFVLPLLVVLAGCSTPGAFFGETDGPAFQAHTPSDGQHALVYLYRPRSDWADQELEAPGLFINNNLIGSLPSNGYLVLEFEAAGYQLEMRRPLFGSFWTLFADGPLDFTRIASFSLETEAGSAYYLRYDELNPPPANGKPNQGDGPLQLVSESLALSELAATRQVQPFEQIAANGDKKPRPQRGFWRSVGRALDKIGI